MLGQVKGHRLEGFAADYVVFDLETTGVSPTHDSVIEISGIRVRNGNPVAEYSSLINPGIPIPPEASGINGITDDMVADAPPLKKVLADFLDFTGNDVLAGHNIHCFDMKYIYRDSLRLFQAVPGNDYIDTLMLSRKWLPQLAHHRLTDVAAHYHISTEGAHRALQDCRMNQEVLECLRREAECSADRTGCAEICPRCGRRMVLRQGRFGEFWGCLGYPVCRFTKNR